MTAPALRRVALAWLGVMAVLLVVFGVFEALGVGLLDDPGDRLRENAAPAAALGVSLLGVDAVLPVASSVVMVALGAVFGVAGGTALSTAGSLAGLVVAAAIGRRGRATLEDGEGYDRQRVAALVDRFGAAAIVVTRPVPILAESAAMMAGATGMAWWRLLAAGAVGTVPVAFLYAVAGDRGSQANGVAVTVALVAAATAAVAVPALRHRRRAAVT